MANSSLGDLFVNVVANTSQFDKSINNSETATNGFNSRLTSLSGTVKKLVGAGVLIALAKKVADVGKASILAASDAQETQNKFDVVFSGISDAANDMATQLAGAYGLSIQGAKDMLAGTGDLLTGLGFTQESAFSLSEQVLTLGADLASFTNYSGGAEGASEALTKSLLGEREMLKGLGISINEADLKAQVLLESQQGLTFETDKQARAAATLSLVMIQSKNAMGDFERSQESFANQSKIAAAAVADLQAELGRALLPTATKGIGIFADLTKNITEHLTSLIDARKVYDSFSKGQETINDKLFVVKKQIAETSVEIDTLEDMYQRATDPKFKKKWQDQLVVLYEQNQVARRIESAIRLEIKAKQDLIDEEKEEARLLEEKKIAEENARQAREQGYIDQNAAVQAILEDNQSEIDAIDAKIEEISKLGLADSKYYDDQQAAIALLQAEKKAILDEEITLEAEKRETLRQGEQDLANEIYAIGLKQAADKEAFRLEEIEGRREAAQFIQDSASNIASIVSNFNTAEINGIEEAKNKKINALDEELLGTEEYNRQKTAIEKASANKIYEIELAQFNTKKALALSQIAIDTAIGVAKVYGQVGIFGLGAQIPVIAMGVAQAAVVLSEPAPARPQLATGAVIAGSQRGVDVTVAEGGNDELILGGGSQGEAILNKFADKINSRGGGQGQTIININSLYPPRKQDLDRLAKDLYTGTIKEQQRRGM